MMKELIHANDMVHLVDVVEKKSRYLHIGHLSFALNAYQRRHSSTVLSLQSGVFSVGNLSRFASMLSPEQKGLTSFHCRDFFFFHPPVVNIIEFRVNGSRWRQALSDLHWDSTRKCEARAAGVKKKTNK